MADGPIVPGAETSQPSPSNAEAGQSSQPQVQEQQPKRESGKISARNDVLAAFDEIEQRGEADAAKAAAKPDGGDAKAPDAKTGEPQRGPDGKFIKTDAQAQQPATDPKAAQQPQPLNAPPSWKGSQKVDWNRLPRAVQEGIAAEFQRYGDVETKFNAINAILAPREQALVAQYGGIDRALNNLFALSDYASRDPAGFIHWFAAQRGINFQQPTQGQQQPGQQFAGQQAQAASLQNIPPELAPLVDRLNGIERYVSQQHHAATLAEQQAVEGVKRQATSDVQALIANSAKYPYANDVRQEMAALFASGQAKTLDEAYESAVYMNKTVRERIIEDRANAELEKRAAAAAEKKQASVSVSGSPGGQMAAGKGNRRATVRDDVLAAANEIGFGGVARL